MRAITIMDGQFTTYEGRPASHHMNYERFGRHFLTEFEHLTIVARQSPKEDTVAELVEGPGVSFVALPSYKGPKQFLATFPTIWKILWRLAKPDTAYVLRVPGTIPALFSLIATLRGIPFALQCVADPADQLGKGSVKHPLRPLFQNMFVGILKWQCKAAGAAMYVTRAALQKRYPPNHRIEAQSYTDLVLDEPAFREERPEKGSLPDRPVILNVGMMAQLYKGQDTLIHAVAICKSRGVEIQLNLVGDGQYKSELEALAFELKVEQQVKFLGKLANGPAIRDELDACDIFCLPSRQEGLPRALMEAMARKVPCLGSDVGGIPELLEPDYIFPADNPEALAGSVLALLATTRTLNKCGQSAYANVQRYRFTNNIIERRKFYRNVKSLYAGQVDGR
jgi:glycosyltransferase involved in cell wall biosynthesis